MATTINQLDDSNLQSQNSFSSVTNNALPQSPTNNLDISAATYLGGEEDDSTNAVDISLDGKFVFVGGSVKNANLGAEKTELLGGGDGTIIRYDSQTNQAVATTHLPGKVIDLEVSNNGDIAVAYEGGIAVLNADATEVKWSQSLSRVMRIAISDTGKVGVLQDSPGPDRAYLYDSDGERLKDWHTGKTRRQFSDIAVTDQNGGMVITTGYEQKTSILQVAFTQAWSYEGEDVWKNYDFDDEDIYAENLMADTRGQRVAIGRDGQLYSSYYVNGGTGFSIFYRDPFNLSEEVTDDRKIETDEYNTPTNVNSIKMSWYGRYNLENGDLIKGQSLLGRRDDGKGNSVDISSIMGTEDGTLIIAGSAAGKIANRDQQTIEGQKVSDYVSFDGYIATISPDFQERLSWTPISDSGGGVVASFRNGTTAAVTTTNFEGSQITHNAIQDSAGGKNDGYLLVIGGNDAPPGTEPTTPPDETPDNTGEDDAPTDETPDNIGEDDAPTDETPDNTGEDDAPTDETPDNTGGDDAPTDETPDNTGEDDAPTDETPDNIGGDDAPTDETPDNIGGDDAPTDETPDNIGGDDAPIDETPDNIGGDDAPTQGDNILDLNSVESYGESSRQDNPENGTVEVSSNNELNLSGNRWQKLEINSTIKDNTVLRFEFAGNGNSEIQGIGFDNDNVVSGADRQKFFQVDGSQNWGINDLSKFIRDKNEDLSRFIVGKSGEKDIYEIPVGEFFTGDFKFLTIVNDDDQINPDAESKFSNIQIFENAPDSLDIAINGQTETEEVLSYGGFPQNTKITSTVSNNSELKLEGNGWKRLDITGYEVTENTVLNFEFAGNDKAEIQGIGFDNDNAVNPGDRKNFFQVDGIQSWGIDDLDEYIVGSENGFTQYSIKVGDFFTGKFDFLTIANDNDMEDAAPVGQFQNIELIG